MILMVSTARPEEHDDAGSQGQLKGRLEKLTGVPAPMQHYVTLFPPSRLHLGGTGSCEIQAMRHSERPVYGTQFHPEAWSDYYQDGKHFMENSFRIAGIIDRAHRAWGCPVSVDEAWRRPLRFAAWGTILGGPLGYLLAHLTELEAIRGLSSASGRRSCMSAVGRLSLPGSCLSHG